MRKARREPVDVTADATRQLIITRLRARQGEGLGPGPRIAQSGQLPPLKYSPEPCAQLASAVLLQFAPARGSACLLVCFQRKNRSGCPEKPNWTWQPTVGLQGYFSSWRAMTMRLIWLVPS